MSDNLLSLFLIVFIFTLIPICAYVADEQEHRHKIELEKAKQGIFDTHQNKDTIKSHLEKILITIVIFSIIVLICYALKIPSNFLDYVLSILK